MALRDVVADYQDTDSAVANDQRLRIERSHADGAPILDGEREGFIAGFHQYRHLAGADGLDQSSRRKLAKPCSVKATGDTRQVLIVFADLRFYDLIVAGLVG